MLSYRDYRLGLGGTGRRYGIRLRFGIQIPWRTNFRVEIPILMMNENFIQIKGDSLTLLLLPNIDLESLSNFEWNREGKFVHCKKKKNWGELTLVLTFSSTLVLSNERHSVPFREVELKGLQEWQDKNKMIKNIFDKALSTEAMQQKFSGTLFSSVRWSWSYSHTIKKCNNKENCLYTTSFT